jgi:hypothetical protein
MLVSYPIKWDNSHMINLLLIPFFLGAITMMLFTLGYKVNYTLLKLTGVTYMVDVKAPTNTEDYYD